ncbi:MAG: hypothetical protein AAFP97_08535 [Pseudomonadota bacterium]
MELFSKTILASAALSLFFIAPASIAQDMSEAIQALDDALPGTLIHNPFDLQWESSGNDIRIKVVDAEQLPTGQAIDARVKKRQSKPWESALLVPISAEVEKGDSIQAYFWIRTTKAAPGADTAKVVFFLGRNEEPYDNIFSEEVLPDSEWKLMNLKGIASADFKDGTLKAEYQLGKASQRVEVGPIYISKLDE